jgi:hypothetical protein
VAHKITVVRKGASNTPSGFSDGGLLLVTGAIGTMLDGECPEAELANMMKSLLKQFGSVSTSTAGVEYIWHECPPPIRWKYVCIATTSHEIDDGGPQPLIVDLEIHTSYPFA